MATVVDFLEVASPMSSMPSLTLVIAASVVRGSMSEIDSTKVLLPTAKPPATTIFTGIGFAPLIGVSSQGLESVEHSLEQTQVWAFV